MFLGFAMTISDQYIDRLRSNGTRCEEMPFGARVVSGPWGEPGWHEMQVRCGGMRGAEVVISTADLTLSFELDSRQIEAYVEAFVRFLMASTETGKLQTLARDLMVQVAMIEDEEQTRRREQ